MAGNRDQDLTTNHVVQRLTVRHVVRPRVSRPAERLVSLSPTPTSRPSIVAAHRPLTARPLTARSGFFGWGSQGGRQRDAGEEIHTRLVAWATVTDCCATATQQTGRGDRQTDRQREGGRESAYTEQKKEQKTPKVQSIPCSYIQY